MSHTNSSFDKPFNVHTFVFNQSSNRRPCSDSSRKSTYEHTPKNTKKKKKKKSSESRRNAAKWPFQCLLHHVDDTCSNCTILFPTHAAAARMRFENDCNDASFGHAAVQQNPWAQASDSAAMGMPSQFICRLQDPPVASTAVSYRCRSRSRGNRVDSIDRSGYQQKIDSYEDADSEMCSVGWPLRRYGTTSRSGDMGDNNDALAAAAAAAPEKISVIEWALRLPERRRDCRGVEEELKLLQENTHASVERLQLIGGERRGRRSRRAAKRRWAGGAAGGEGAETGERRGLMMAECSGGAAAAAVVAAVRKRAAAACRGRLCREFETVELKVATECYAEGNMIGEGGCSRVYRGMLRDGKLIAVKRMAVEYYYNKRRLSVDWKKEERESEFVREVEMGSRLNHRRIAKLLGYGVHIDIEDKEASKNNDGKKVGYSLLLVYNLASEGNLYKMLHYSTSNVVMKRRRGGGGGAATYAGVDATDAGVDAAEFNFRKIIMAWNARFRVAVGIAQALHYLHHVCSPPVIHRDIKSSNILLSSNLLEPQLSDFGLAMWSSSPSASHDQLIPCSRVVGTFGYLAPEYLMYESVSLKTDVYSFGVVLLELLTGRKPIDYPSPQNESKEILVSWARRLLVDLNESNIAQLVDPNLDGAYDRHQFKRLAIAAAHCLRQSPLSRPPITWVLSLLVGELDNKNNADHDQLQWSGDTAEETYWSYGESIRSNFTAASTTPIIDLMEGGDAASSTQGTITTVTDMVDHMHDANYDNFSSVTNNHTTKQQHSIQLMFYSEDHQLLAESFNRACSLRA